MKKTILSSIFILTMGISIYAQDVITLRNGDEIKAKVTEISSSEIKYKKYDNLDGPTIVVAKSEVFAINYENGTRDVINAATVTPASTQRQVTPATVRESSVNRDKTYFGIYANPIGFVTFGPIIGLEVQKNKFIGEFHLRFPTMGLLMPYMDDWEYGYDCTIKSGLGIGLGLKFFNPGLNGGLYVGGLLEFSNYEAHYSDGYGESAGIAFGVNVGYKFMWTSGVYLRTGGYLGAYRSSKYDWHNSYGDVRSSSGDITVFGLLDLSIGISF